MKVQVEVAILEKSILTGLVENSIKAYMEQATQKMFDHKEALKVISDELEKIKDLNLVSFYGVSSHVNIDMPKCGDDNE